MSRLFSPFYDRFSAAAEEACLKSWREQLLKSAHGTVLEIGAGTGANLPFYTTAVSKLILNEPDAGMRHELNKKLANYPHLTVEWATTPLEQIDLPDQSVDFVVGTLVLCSVKSQSAALQKIHRLLKPNGRYLFIEHVAAENKPERLKWQNRLNPIWKRVAGNCHINRRTLDAIEANGFTTEGVIRESMRKAMPVLRPTIRGTAVRMVNSLP
jgi:ubiquinone/menaquinone biosynthesis C-methylase UbiE